MSALSFSRKALSCSSDIGDGVFFLLLIEVSVVRCCLMRHREPDNEKPAKQRGMYLDECLVNCERQATDRSSNWVLEHQNFWCNQLFQSQVATRTPRSWPMPYASVSLCHQSGDRHDSLVYFHSISLLRSGIW